MPGFLPSFKQAPLIARVSINQGNGVVGSFIDPEWVFHYVVAGEWEFILESKSYRVSEGNVILLPPHLLHIVKPVAGKRLVQWVVHFQSPEGAVVKGDYPYVVQLPSVEREKVATLFSLLKEEWETKRERGLPSAAGLVMAMLGIHAVQGEAVSPKEGEIGNWKNIESALKSLQMNYANPDLTLGDLSDAAELSLTHFCRAFKSRTGLSAMQYLTRYRIQKGESLLLNSSLNCSEIADKIGLESVHRLSHLFRKIKGISPTAYRKRHGH
jgi:AraC-like DNA-binding protein